MSKSIIVSDDTFVSLNEARRLITAVGDQITVILKGEPGMGKTSMLAQIAIDNGDEWRRPGDYFPDDKYHYVYIDCTVEEIGDRKMQIPVHATKTLETYVSSALHIFDKRPVVILADEYMKCPRALQVIWTRLMLERTLGDIPLPAGSIVYATSNHTSDGVGDTVQAHVGNRVMILNVRKPSAIEWLQWAGANGVNRVVRAWVSANKRVLASYLDGESQKDNPYIFNPGRSGAVSFVTPRSLTKAGVLLDRGTGIPDRVLGAALSGLIGKAGAEGLLACMHLNDRIAKTADILRDPTGIDLPDDAIAQILMMINGAEDVQTQDDVSKFMRFVSRIPNEEVQSIFFLQMVTSPRTVMLTRNNEALKKWRLDNFEMLV